MSGLVSSKGVRGVLEGRQRANAGGEGVSRDFVTQILSMCASDSGTLDGDTKTLGGSHVVSADSGAAKNSFRRVRKEEY